MIELTSLKPTLALDAIMFVLGSAIGSFLNVLALRTLAESSFIWPPSHCPRCHAHIKIYDNIPLLSWLILRGRCRNCGGQISWQYPAVELFTGLTFVAIERIFLDVEHSPFNNDYWNHLLQSFVPQASRLLQPDPTKVDWSTIVFMPGSPWNPLPTDRVLWLAAGALFLACTLIAVTVTDFREKLIPHDITYPAMIVGIIFSTVVRQDLLGAIAGIGASYILFDFIAFYGLKVYLRVHGGTEPGRARTLERRLMRRKRRRRSRKLRWRLDLASIKTSQQEEPIEVMGGGDAVLSAVMSAFLGWQLLLISLILGFLVGTIMGLGLLLNEMRKANLLHKCLKTCAIFAIVGATAFAGIGVLMINALPVSDAVPIAIPMTVLGAVAGFLMGVVSVGTHVSKPYPFGPALAAGGFIAIFLLPNWLYLNSIAASLH